jgi:hypothetical protein
MTIREAVLYFRGFFPKLVLFAALSQYIINIAGRTSVYVPKKTCAAKQTSLNIHEKYVQTMYV